MVNFRAAPDGHATIAGPWPAQLTFKSQLLMQIDKHSRVIC